MLFKWKTIERTLILTAAFVAVVGLFLGWNELKNLRLNNSAGLVLQIDQMLATPISQELIQAIEKKEPLFKKNDGKFEDWQIDVYIGVYETLYNLYANDLISEDMLYSAFSYNLEKAYANEEVMEYIFELQKDDSQVFLGFLELGEFYSELELD